MQDWRLLSLSTTSLRSRLGLPGIWVMNMEIERYEMECEALECQGLFLEIRISDRISRIGILLRMFSFSGRANIFLRRRKKRMNYYYKKNSLPKATP
jgi:hypothetical protein